MWQYDEQMKLKVGLAEMLKGGVIMDVTTAEQAKIAEDAGELLVKARDRHVIFAPARYFYFQDPQHNAFRLCFTAVSDEQLGTGVRILGELLTEEISKGKTGEKRTPVGSGVALV